MNGVSSSRLPLLCLTIAQLTLFTCSFAGGPPAPDGAKVVIVAQSPQSERLCHEGCKYRVRRRGGSLKLKFGGSER
jgi:hypothetical protein